MSLYRMIGYHEGHIIANHPIYGVIGYHVTLSEGHMIANHPIEGNTCAPSCGNFDLFILYKGWYITFNVLLQWTHSYSTAVCLHRYNNSVKLNDLDFLCFHRAG